MWIQDDSGYERGGKTAWKRRYVVLSAELPETGKTSGAFVKDSEVEQVVEFLTQQNNPETYNAEMQVQLSQVTQAAQDLKNSGSDVDEYFADAGKFIIEKDKASIGMLQRMFKIGFNRAARIMDQLSDAGVVGPEEGTKPRKVLMSMEQFENYLEQGQ